MHFRRYKQVVSRPQYGANLDTQGRLRKAKVAKIPARDHIASFGKNWAVSRSSGLANMPRELIDWKANE